LEQDQIPQVFNAIDKQQVMSFIEKNAPIPGLDVQVAKLAMYVVETCPRRVNLTALTQQLLRTVEDCVYTATLASWPQDFVGTAQWPPLRTKVDPHAVATLKESTIQVRNDTLKAIYNRYQTETKCDKPMYVPESGYMHWLSDVDTVVRLAVTKQDNSAKKLKNSCLTALKVICSFCDALQQPQLKNDYIAAFEIALQSAPEPKEKRMTEDQVVQLYAQIERMRQAAMPMNSERACVDYLSLALLYGDSPGLLQPQRNDLITYRFHGPKTRPTSDNYIRLLDSGGATLTINFARKKGKLPHPVTIDLSDNKLLCKFLKSYQVFTASLQPHTTEPYLLIDKSGQPLSMTNYTTRVGRLWIKLEGILGFKAAGCIQARRASVDCDRRAHGQRKRSADEILEQQTHCKQRLHSVSMSEKY
jgi:hypothetical protein